MSIRRGQLKIKELTYGECPSCGVACQPPDPAIDGLEFCCCCDCRIMWNIIHNDKTKNLETWQERWSVQDIETFEDAGFSPYGCDD